MRKRTSATTPATSATPPAPRCRVVLTRQPAQAGDLEDGLRAAGCEVAFLPLTDFELPADPDTLQRAVAGLAAGEYRWVVATSPNTVRALARAGWDGRLPAGTRVAVTGPGTARVLAEHGCTRSPWMPDGDASGAGILAQFPASDGRSSPGASPTEPDRPDRLLLPQSALATEELAEGLRSTGWDVHRVIAYRTVPYPAVPGRRLLDGPSGTEHGAVVGVEELAGAAVVLTSPSAARELVRHPALTDPRTLAATRFVAIGHPTQHAAESVGIPLNRTAASPDVPGVLAALGTEVDLEDPVVPLEEFAEPGELRDRLVTAILEGRKTATAALLAEHETQGVPVPCRGDRGRVLDSSGRVVAVIETTSVDVVALGQVPEWHALAEGEGEETVHEWRLAHERFWAAVTVDDDDGEPPRLDDGTPVVLQSFVRIR